jgi:photosystem II stability/assembly factor-like uncharacterized protein
MIKIRPLSAVLFALFAFFLSSCSEDPIDDPGTTTAEFENFGAPSSVFGNRIVKNGAGDLLLATGGGLYRYKFSSTSWEIVGNTDMWGYNIEDVAIMQNGNVVCGSPSRALFLSTDNGNTWKTTYVSNSLKGIRFFIGNRFESWASIKGEDGKYTALRTEDYGASWAQRITPKNAPEDKISLCFNDSDDVFFANADGLYRSLDSGRTYKLMSSATGINYLFCNKAGHILAFKDGAGMISTDSGRGLADAPIPGGIKEVTRIQSGQLYAVASYTTPPNEAALYRSDDDGAHWSTSHFFGRPTNSITEVGTTLYVATSGFGVLSSQNADDWNGIGPGISTTFSLAVDKDDNLLTASFGIYRSSDGNTWTDLGITSEQTANLAASPQGYMMRATGNKFYTSLDNGANWISINLVGGINALAFMPNGYGVYGTDMHLSVSTNQLVTFNALPIGKNVDVEAIGISSKYAIFFSYKEGSTFNFWRSLDSGKTFSNANSGIENILMTSIAVGPTGTVYASDGTKLYQSKDNGSAWTTFIIGGLPGGDRVNAMTFRADGKLYLGTNTAIIKSKVAME